MCSAGRKERGGEEEEKKEESTVYVYKHSKTRHYICPSIESSMLTQLSPVTELSASYF